MGTTIDLAKEQTATLQRSALKHSMMAKIFFKVMDVITGSEITLPKAALIEMLASIPYRAWEGAEYVRSSLNYTDGARVKYAEKLQIWNRYAQDNEYGHLLVIQEKMRLDGVSDPWWLMPPVPYFFMLKYRVLSWFFTRLSQRQAWLFNAEFEDHAEHVYAQFVQEHPEWDAQPVAANPVVLSVYGDLATWGDVFRRVGLDERDHRNKSFVLAGETEKVVAYDGMPE